MTDETEDTRSEYADAMRALFDPEHLADMMAFPLEWSPPCSPHTVARPRPERVLLFGSAVTPGVADLLTRLAPIPVDARETPPDETTEP